MLLRKLSWLVMTLWVGSLWMTGLTASILFDGIIDRSLAGEVAGQLFATVSYMGIAIATFLLLAHWFMHGARSIKQPYVWIISLMLVLILIGYFGVQSHLAQLKAEVFPVAVMLSANARQFAVWHGISGAIYLTECLLGVALILNSRQIELATV